MEIECIDRRKQNRCSKNVGMQCVGLHVEREQTVLIRNFSDGGIYFESERSFSPGSYIILREMDSEDRMVIMASDALVDFTINDTQASDCQGFRSHVLARVRRCESLSDNVYSPRFGIGAKIQFLSESA